MFKKPQNKLGEEEGRREKIKRELKKIDDLKRVLTNTANCCIRLSEQTKKHAENDKLFAETLFAFSQKENGSLGPDHTDTAFAMGMTRFAEVFVDLHKLELEFSIECVNLSNKVNQFVSEQLDKNQGHLKIKIRNYEVAKTEYDKCLLKIQKIRDKRAVVKLYEAEKERAKEGILYEISVFELESHCDDIDDLLTTRLLEDFITFYNAQKNMLGLSYGQLDDLKVYLTSLKEWCKQELYNYEENKKEREIQRYKLQKTEAAITISQFVSMFNTSPELFDIIGTLAKEHQMEHIVVPAFKALFVEAEIPIADALKDKLKNYKDETISPSKSALETTRNFIKDNFDPIGNRILEEYKNKDLLINLGGLLSSLEQLQIDTKQRLENKM
jgi:hypothetical protein